MASRWGRVVARCEAADGRWAKLWMLRVNRKPVRCVAGARSCPRGHVVVTGPFEGIPSHRVVGSSSNLPPALPLVLISIASRHCSSGKVRAMGMLNFPAAAACAISPNAS